MLIVSMYAASASAQPFGRWWWDARLGLGQSYTDNQTEGQDLNSYDQQQLRLLLGLNGYLGHPALGKFRVAVNSILSKFEGGRLDDSQAFGGEALIELLPQGDYPANLFYRRDLFDYGQPQLEEDRFPILGLPDVTTRWGGRVRINKGPLRRVRVAIDRTAIDYLDPDADSDVQDRQSVEWSTGASGLRTTLRGEHRLRDYGRVDLNLEEFIARLLQQGELAPTWRWEANAWAISRDTETQAELTTTRDLQLRSRVRHDLHERDLLELIYDVGYLDPDPGLTRTSHLGVANYRWRPKDGWQITPFGVFGYESAEDLTLTSPRIGLGLTRFWSRDGFSARLGGRASYGQVSGRRNGLSRDDSTGAFSLNGSVGFGRMQGLRKDFEFEASHNELRLDRELAPPIIGDLPILRVGLTADDYARARVTLGHSWRHVSLTGWAQGSYRQSSGRIDLPDFDTYSYQAAGQLSNGTFSLQAQLGEGEQNLDVDPIVSTQPEEQIFRFANATARWRPIRTLELGALYRLDDRSSPRGPSFDAEQLDLIFKLRFGAFILEGRAFHRTQDQLEGREHVNRGFRWSLSRRFSGWLPVVTGTQRRGTVR